MPRRFTSSLAVIGSLAISLFLVGGAKANADALFESAALGVPTSVGGNASPDYASRA